MPGRTLLTNWASSISAGVAPGQFAGTDSRPSVPAWPIPADTGAPPLPSPPRPANCGHTASRRPAAAPSGGNAAGCAAAAAAGGNVSCWAKLMLKLAIPTPKYACRVCLRIVVILAFVMPVPSHPPLPMNWANGPGRPKKPLAAVVEPDVAPETAELVDVVVDDVVVDAAVWAAVCAAWPAACPVAWATAAACPLVS